MVTQCQKMATVLTTKGLFINEFNLNVYVQMNV